MRPPRFEFGQSGEANSNNRVIDRVFQFAAQYVYADGEVSAIGPYSKLTYEDNHFNVDGTMADLYNTPFDSIDVIQDKVKIGNENQDGDVVAVSFWLELETQVRSWCLMRWTPHTTTTLAFLTSPTRRLIVLFQSRKPTSSLMPCP